MTKADGSRTGKSLKRFIAVLLLISIHGKICDMALAADGAGSSPDVKSSVVPPPKYMVDAKAYLDKKNCRAAWMLVWKHAYRGDLGALNGVFSLIGFGAVTVTGIDKKIIVQAMLYSLLSNDPGLLIKGNDMRLVLADFLDDAGYDPIRTDKLKACLKSQEKAATCIEIAKDSGVAMPYGRFILLAKQVNTTTAHVVCTVYPDHRK